MIYNITRFLSYLNMVFARNLIDGMNVVIGDSLARSFWDSRGKNTNTKNVHNMFTTKTVGKIGRQKKCIKNRLVLDGLL